MQGHVTDRVTALEMGIEAARKSGGHYDEGAFLNMLGIAYSALGEVEKAIDHQQQALLIHREIGYRQGEASNLGNLGLAYSNQGEVEKARKGIS